MKSFFKLLLYAVVFSLSILYAATFEDLQKEKWDNNYVGFDPQTHRYEQYAFERNRFLYKAFGRGAKKITCSFYSAKNKDIVYINPGLEMLVQFRDASGFRHESMIVVGDALSEDFGCMGACGPSCPRRGLPVAFTLDCLKHDLCVYKFGADPINKRADHPSCGHLFENAIDDWCSSGHLFQGELSSSL